MRLFIRRPLKKNFLTAQWSPSPVLYRFRTLAADSKRIIARETFLGRRWSKKKKKKKQTTTTTETNGRGTPKAAVFTCGDWSCVGRAGCAPEPRPTARRRPAAVVAAAAAAGGGAGGASGADSSLTPDRPRCGSRRPPASCPVTASWRVCWCSSRDPAARSAPEKQQQQQQKMTHIVICFATPLSRCNKNDRVLEWKTLVPFSSGQCKSISLAQLTASLTYFCSRTEIRSSSPVQNKLRKKLVYFLFFYWNLIDQTFCKTNVRDYVRAVTQEVRSRKE